MGNPSTEQHRTIDLPLTFGCNLSSNFILPGAGNVTLALKSTGMWANTLLVYSPDNGGYLGNGGDDTPLRGGKFSDFQGGVNVAAWAAGGLIPAVMRGTTVSGYIHIWSV